MNRDDITITTLANNCAKSTKEQEQNKYAYIILYIFL